VRYSWRLFKNAIADQPQKVIRFLPRLPRPRRAQRALSGETSVCDTRLRACRRDFNRRFGILLDGSWQVHPEWWTQHGLEGSIPPRM